MVNGSMKYENIIISRPAWYNNEARVCSISSFFKPTQRFLFNWVNSFAVACQWISWSKCSSWLSEVTQDSYRIGPLVVNGLLHDSGYSKWDVPRGLHYQVGFAVLHVCFDETVVFYFVWDVYCFYAFVRSWQMLLAER